MWPHQENSIITRLFLLAKNTQSPRGIMSAVCHFVDSNQRGKSTSIIGISTVWSIFTIFSSVNNQIKAPVVIVTCQCNTAQTLATWQTLGIYIGNLQWSPKVSSHCTLLAQTCKCSNQVHCHWTRITVWLSCFVSFKQFFVDMKSSYELTPKIVPTIWIQDLRKIAEEKVSMHCKNCGLLPPVQHTMHPWFTAWGDLNGPWLDYSISF